MIDLLSTIFKAEHTISQVLRTIIHSSIYLALGSVALTYFAAVALNVSPDIGAYLISFLMVFAMYNMNRQTDLSEDEISHPERHLFTVQYKKHIGLIAYASAILAFIIGLIRGIEITIVILIPVILALLYSHPWIPSGIVKSKRLKGIPLIKNVVISISWTLITAFVAVFYFNPNISLPLLCVSAIIFTRLFINTIVFDVRDMEGDKSHNILTLPLLIGVHKTKQISLIINTLLIIFTFIVVYKGILPPLVHLVNLTSVQVYYYLYMLDKDVDMVTLCDVFADGEFILMGIAAYVGKIVF